MNDLNKNLKYRIDFLIQRFKDTPKHLHFEEIIGIEDLASKINSLEHDEILFEDIILLRYKEIISIGLSDDIKAKNLSEFSWKMSYDENSLEFVDDYTQFCLEKYFLEESEVVSSAWRNRMDSFIGSDFSKRVKIDSSVDSVPNHIRDYILKSLNGPKILYKLTFNNELLRLLNDVSVSDSLRHIKKYEDQNFLRISNSNAGVAMYKFKNDSKIFQGLSRLSLVFFGFLALACSVGVAFESTMNFVDKIGVVLLIVLGFYVIHMLTLWVIDGFTNTNSND